MFSFFKRNSRIYLVVCAVLICLMTEALIAGGITKSPNRDAANKPTDTASKNSQSISRAVSLAILGQSKGYGPGECSTEGHIILDTEEKGGMVKIYTIASFGAFGFENGIFTKVSGSGAIPTVITLKKGKNASYDLIKCVEPMDGSYYSKSIKQMFPKRLWNKVLSSNNSYASLAKQQEEQAGQYLGKIGRKARVSEAYVNKTLVKINVQASNKLFSEMTKYDTELNNFPYWIGSREIIENNVRYIYATSQSKTANGYDLVTLKKTKVDGTTVKEYKYKIVGGEPKLLP